MSVYGTEYIYSAYQSSSSVPDLLNWNIKEIWSLLEDTFAFKLCASKAVEVVNEEEKDNERQNNNNTNGDDDGNDDDRGVVLKHHHHPMLFEYHDAASCKIEYSSKTLR